MWTPYPETLVESPLGEIEVELSHPGHHHVVMGASGKADQEVFEEELLEAGIPLHKRKGGGGTVLLGPEIIVVTVHAGVAHRFRNLAYFHGINQALIDVMSTWQGLPYAQRGISDIAVNDRKIVGSSIFRRRQYLLYQASILVELNLPLMDRLLRPPTRQPDYRRNRNHADFVTSLRALGINHSFEDMMEDLRQGLPGRLRIHLDEVDARPEEL